MDLLDQIYYSLAGEMESALPWVLNAFAPGSLCSAAYSRLLEARNRVLEKMDRTSDPDLNCMLEEMEIIQRILCRILLELRCM